jgi:hypothetical protein
MSYDPIAEADSIDELIEEYGMSDHADLDNPNEQMQVELLEALNQIGPQVMDDTKKRNAIWSIIRTLAILRADGANGNEFTAEPLPAEVGLPSTQGDRHSKIRLQTDNGTIESIIH